jgi:hypothetical protein
MPDTPRVFTLEEANATLPRLNLILRRQLRVLAEVQERMKALSGLGWDGESLAPAPDEEPARVALKLEIHERVLTLRDGFAQVEAIGAVVKDAHQGLVDFYGLRDGRPVWLCWRYGEPSVAHWHPLDSGFSERRRIEGSEVPPTLN